MTKPINEADLIDIEARCEAATPLVGYPGYGITTDGTVWSLHSNWRGYGPRPLVPSVGRSGYLKVRMTTETGQRIGRPVHRLVAETFLGVAPRGAQVRHLNGNKVDNRASNLAWGTAAENADDRDRHGTTARGIKNGAAKLTDDAVQHIRQLRKHGISQRTIGRMIGVSQKTVFNVLAGNSWQHVSDVSN